MKHELAGIETKALFAQRDFHWSAEGHELRFNARKLRNRAHGEEHLIEQALSDGSLRKFRGDIEAADQALLFFQDVEGVACGAAIFKRDASREGVRVHESFDQFQSAAVIPMEFIAPVPRFLFKKRLELADRRLAQVDNIHG